MQNDNLKIVDGSTIAVIGGGPAGSAAAIKLIKEAAKKGMKIRVVIFEGKDFDRHYNQCVGVLSHPIREIFEQSLEMPFPEQLIKREISGYVLHPANNTPLELTGERGTYATRRILFDRFMLQTAQELGATVIRSRVTDIELNNGGDVKIYAEDKFIRADAVVGAFGLDDGIAAVTEHASRHAFAYKRPPKVLNTLVAKAHIDLNMLQERFGSKIHAFIPLELKKIEFGAITPKGDHIIINIAGRNLTSADMDNFLDYPPVSRLIKGLNLTGLDYYKGKYPIRPAGGIIGDRFAAVGDATGLIRPYKGKGINVALETGAKAAEIMIKNGISASALSAYPGAFAHLRADFFYGRLFRLLVILSIKTGFVEQVMTMAKSDPYLRDVLFKVVSGEGTYHEVVHEIFSIKEFAKLGFSFFRHLPAAVFKAKPSAGR
jgi:flavin-dependent dehydrogenase